MTALQDEVIKDNQHSANANGDKYHQQEQEMEMATAMEQQHQQLAILICSANIGNAEPTRESFGAWIPSDGGFVIARGGGCDKHEMTKNDVCCCSVVDDNNVDEDDDDIINQRKQKKKFDIIVIGMQEAAFINISTDSSNNNHNSEDYEDGSSSNTKNSKQVVDEVGDTDDNDDSAKKGDSDIINDSNGDNDKDESIRDCRGGDSGEETTTASGLLFDMVSNGITEFRRGGEKSSRRMIQNIDRGSLFVRGLGFSPPKTTLLPRTMLNRV